MVALIWVRTAQSPGDCSPAIEASLRPDVLPEAVAMFGRYRSLRLGATLVARAPGIGSHRAVDAARLCEALLQAAEERCEEFGDGTNAKCRAALKFLLFGVDRK
jgi:hypothetical protein